MKKVILTLAILISTLIAFGQTNVSGGIFSNTTWTVANSPYIVTDTIVVFPGVTLTIQPGVQVKFTSNTRLEIRQSRLIALGTITDSITFTSNALSPTAGVWLDIFFNQSDYSKFNYCNFYYADKSICPIDMYDTITIKNSTFKYNNTGLGCVVHSEIIIDSCVFKQNVIGIQGGTGRINMANSIVMQNQNGILSPERSTYRNCTIDSNNILGVYTFQNDTIINCQIKYNGIGIEYGSISSGGVLITKNIIENNIIGIQTGLGLGTVICNRICNNTSYDLKNTYSWNTDCNSGFNCFADNDWCTNDPLILASHIYDGYDDINLGILSVMPIDTSQCYLPIGIQNIPLIKMTLSISPNPFSTYTIFKTNAFLTNASLKIYNYMGQVLIEKKNISGQAITLNRANLTNGVYILQLMENSNVIAVEKLIVAEE